ncbi:hypothetical protein KQX54_004859 [Cotesia glomerata]|uniref:Uncharacterized protein n=1 Tax=Cotesia glomerata TaxID=32391 RepID=A0AAV7ITG3_COTGL|nr:hypothetical protein KQX54_004859 [Cotesia glomerata]
MALKTLEPGIESDLRSVRKYERLDKSEEMKNRIEAREEYDQLGYDILVGIHLLFCRISFCIWRYEISNGQEANKADD